MKICIKVKIIMLFFTLLFSVSNIGNHILNEYNRDIKTCSEYQREIILEAADSEFYINPDLYVTDHIWSSDGKKVAYIIAQENQTWACDLWVADKIPNEAELVNHTEILTNNCRYNGLMDFQGDWILFIMDRVEGFADSYNGDGDLWKIKANGSDLTQVINSRDETGVGQGIWQRWDGTCFWGKFIPWYPWPWIYFGAHDGHGWFRSYIASGDGTSIEYHISNPYYAWPWSITMSLNCTKLFWGHSEDFNLPTTIMYRNLTGVMELSEIATIKSLEYRISSFLILADESTVIWSNNGNVYAIDIDGSSERTVIDDEYFNREVCCNPILEKELIIQTNRSRDGNLHLFRIKVNGTNLIQVTEGSFNDESPLISPDGQFIAYRRLSEDYSGTTQPHPYELVIKKIAEDTNPTWDETPSDQTVEIGFSFTYDVNASDNSGIEYYWLNDTENFQIDNRGVITNATTLSIGTYWLMINATDYYANTCSKIIRIIVRNSIPVFTSTPDDFSYKIGQTGNYLLWIFSDVSTNNPTYSLSRNNHTLYTDESCESNQTIIIPVDGLNKGLYCFYIEINDGYGAFVGDTVWVEVESIMVEDNLFILGIVIGLLVGLVAMALVLLRNKIPKR